MVLLISAFNPLIISKTIKTSLSQLRKLRNFLEKVILVECRSAWKRNRIAHILEGEGNMIARSLEGKGIRMLVDVRGRE